MTRLLYLLFVLSGAAGLIYESIWTRYLGLFVGHDAYAQIVVLVIFMGGMSLGAILISGRSERLAQPLYGYVAIEALVGVIGLVFHDVYQGATGWAYASIFPALAGSALLPVAKWGLASLLILPQSVLLGATFPLMSAGVLRLQPAQPGRVLSLLYFANSLGAAAGVLVAGFYLVGLAGLPGTLMVAAILNLVVALLTLVAIVSARGREADAAEQAGQAADAPAALAAEPAPARPAAEDGPAEPVLAPAALRRLLLGVSFGTAIASFIYEIDWIRMLSLVLGGATHSFELMLSAFILGLALGALWIRSRADRIRTPLHTLGIVQWVMGLLALATLPVYVMSFEWLRTLMSAFAPTGAGYAGFTLARYALCLVIMLPATFCAGMTLPLITRTLMQGGGGERTIGAVYAWNTLGSIIGVALGGLVLLPLAGLKGMLVLGASADMLIGAALIWAAGRGFPAVRRQAGAAALATAVVALAVAVGVRLDRNLLSSGVYRSGNIATDEDRTVRFYRDGRTATVAGLFTPQISTLSLATNGKADASLTTGWFTPCRDVKKRTALRSDEATQALLPLVTLAHRPAAGTAAVIGQGSGMSTHFLLGSAALREAVTIEIEPQMIEGSRIFYPANRRAFDDPRSRMVIDDAKSYFASADRRFDLILSEPSNPWVSGVSGLFTTEFYGQVRRYLAPGGVFGQWLHTYDLDDALVLSVLSALHENFPSYQVYMVSAGDLLVVAGTDPELPTPDWSVLGGPAISEDLCRFEPVTTDQLDALWLAGRRELAPLLDSLDATNSDYYPVLDLGAERRRYQRDQARGFTALSREWFNLLRSVSGRRLGPSDEPRAALPGTPRAWARALGATVRRGPTADSVHAGVRGPLARAQGWRAQMAQDAAPVDWQIWVGQMDQMGDDLDGGTAGVADEAFYAQARAYAERHGAPAGAREAIAFKHAMAGWNFAEAARAADRLAELQGKQQGWLNADELRDGAVIAKLHLGDVAGARRTMEALAKTSRRGPGDLRTLLLTAYVERAEQQRQVAGR